MRTETSIAEIGKSTFAVLLMLIVIPYLISISLDFRSQYEPSVSDLYINYQAGFVRRGLIGELAYYIQSNNILDAESFFRGIFAILYFLQIILFGSLVYRWRAHGIVVLMSLLSPALLLFPIYDSAAFLRKDVFMVVSMLVHGIVFLGQKSFERYLIYLFFLIFPLLIISSLVHEVQAFLLSFHVVLSYLKFSGEPRLRLVSLLSLYGIPAILGGSAFVFKGSEEAARVICSSWQPPVPCNAMRYLGVTLDYAFASSPIHSKSPMIWLNFVIATVGALLPAVWVVKSAGAGARKESIVRALVCCCLIFSPLFLIAIDWGRWIHLLSMHSLIAVLSVLSPRLVEAEIRNAARSFSVVVVAIYLSGWYLPHSHAGMKNLSQKSLFIVWGEYWDIQFRRIYPMI